MSALVGIAIEKGYIQDVDQPLSRLFPEAALAEADDLKKSIALRDLLMMASGLRCRDSYLYRWEGLNQMRMSGDWAQFVLDLPMDTTPGEQFEYCNGVSYLLSAILQNTTKMKTIDFARKHLFGPLGIEIKEVDWPESPQGITIGYGELWLKPEDMAKFGLLYLNNGEWDGEQIVPAAWVSASTRGLIRATLFDHYGYQWWVDSAGFYVAVGHKGQFIFVVPEKRLVVVFTSDLDGRDFYVPKQLLEKYIIPAASSTKALPADRPATMRLKALVDRAAKGRAFIWKTLSEGVAQDGLFKRTAQPSFQFTYPLGSKKLVTNNPNQVMRMKDPADINFSASVRDIPAGMPLKDFGPKFYAPSLKAVGTNIEVVSHSKIMLKCNTDAYRTDIEWLWNDKLPITTLLVSAYKDGKCIAVCAHPWKFYYKYEPLVQSLTLE
jgi:CubicO group peptidase (beta-lactamase class C family)